MKIKLLILIIPFFLTLLFSCEGLIEKLVEDQIDKKLLNGNWKAVEYYSNEYEDHFENFDKTNQIGNLLKYSTVEQNCDNKQSHVETRLDRFDLNFTSSDKLTFSYKLYYRLNGFDGNCKPTVIDDSEEFSTSHSWKLDLLDQTLTIVGVGAKKGDVDFIIDELTANRMVLMIDGENYTKIVFKK